MPYTPPAQAFVNNFSPVGGGVGQAIDAATLNGFVSGLVDHENRLQRGVLDLRDYATIDGTTDDTAGIQAWMNAAVAQGKVAFHPGGMARHGVLTVPTGLVMRGIGPGGFGIAVPDSQHSRFAAKAGVNANLWNGPVGTAHVRFENIHFDGNKNNNTSGDLFNLPDAVTAEEAQWVWSNCFVDASPGYGIYVGNGRRGCKIVDKTIVNYSRLSGIRMNGSDGHVDKCMIGSNLGNGIEIGASITRVTGCDIWGNGTSGDSSTGTGVLVLSTIGQVNIQGNGIDRNLRHGISLNAGAKAVTITSNMLHSNSQNSNGGAHGIFVNTTEPSVTIANNTFGIDSGITNNIGYCIYLNDANSKVQATGNVVAPGSSNLGLTNAPDRATAGQQQAFNVKDYGATLDGTTDDRAAFQAAVDAAVAAIASTGCGATVLIPPGVAYFNTSYPSPPATHPGAKLGVALPVNLAAPLTIKGSGRGATVIKLSANAKNAFWINKQANYDVFRNVTFEDFDVNNNNSVGRCHSLIGNVPEYVTQQTYLSFDNLHFRRLGTYGYGYDATQATTYKSFVQFAGRHATGDEATATFSTDITFEDIEMLDVQNGLCVESNVTAAYNHYYNNIKMRRCSHVISTYPAQTLSQTSYYICGSGYGDYCEIVDCYSENIGDDAIEIGAMQTVLIDRFRSKNAFLVAILFRITSPLKNPQAQQVTIRDSQISIDATPFNTSGITGFNGKPVGWITDDADANFGTFNFERCSHDVDDAVYSKFNRSSLSDYGWSFSGQIRRVTMDRCSVHYRDFVYDSATTQDRYFLVSSLFPVGITNSGVSSPATAVIRDYEIVWDGGTSTGGGQLNLFGVSPGGPKGHVTVDGLTMHFFNATHGGGRTLARPGVLGSPELVTLKRLTGMSVSGQAVTRRGVQMRSDATTLTTCVIEDCDFRQWANANGRDVDYTSGGANNAGVVERNNLYFSPAGRVTTAANYTMTYLTTHIGVTSTAATRTITLPPLAAAGTAPTVPVGTIYTISDESGGAGTNNITVAASGSDLIEGSGTKAISSNYGTVKVYSTGSAWKTV